MSSSKGKTNLLPLENNPFALSIGDLMSALLLIFILLLSGRLLQLKKQLESEKAEMEKKKIEHQRKAELASDYRELQDRLKEKLDPLSKEFNAEFVAHSLLIRF